MSRWHEASCLDPSISIQENIPHCLSCGASASGIQNLLGKSDSGVLDIPEDEPEGQLNLTWPPSIPWRRGPVSGGPGKETLADSPSRAASPASTDAGEAATHSPMYGRALHQDEIRLLCLAASEDSNAPYMALSRAIPTTIFRSMRLFRTRGRERTVMQQDQNLYTSAHSGICYHKRETARRF